MAFDPQRVGFGVFLLSSQVWRAQALGAESMPLIGLLLLANGLQNFAREGLPFPRNFPSAW
jgi:hypothetical protein